MTNEQLFKLLGNTDDALLDENVEVTTAAPKRRWIAWTAAAAACVCLCAVGAKVLPGMLPRSEEMTAATGDDTFCNNFWVPLENGIRYETVFCGTELEDPANFQAIQFILDPWHMEYQIIDPMAGGNAEIERGTYTVENGICTLVSPDGKMSQLQQIEDSSAWQWELKVLSCDSYPDYAGMVFTSKMNSLRPYEGMNTPDGVNADGTILNEAQTAQFCELLDAMIVYQSVSVPADAPGRENAVRFSFLDQSTEDGLYEGITLFDQWICYDDGTGWLADAAQVAELMALYEEVQASSAADAEGWKPFAEMDASEIPAAAVYYPSADAQEIQYLDKEVPELVAMLQEFTAYGQCMAIPEVNDTPYSIQFEYTDGRYLQIGIYSEYLYISDSLGDTIYAADPEDCAALIEWMDAFDNQQIIGGRWDNVLEMQVEQFGCLPTTIPEDGMEELLSVMNTMRYTAAYTDTAQEFYPINITAKFGDGTDCIQINAPCVRYQGIQYWVDAETLDTLYELIGRYGFDTAMPAAEMPFAGISVDTSETALNRMLFGDVVYSLTADQAGTLETLLGSLELYPMGTYYLEYGAPCFSLWDVNGTEFEFSVEREPFPFITIDQKGYWIAEEDYAALAAVMNEVFDGTSAADTPDDVTIIIAQITEINGSNITVNEYVFGGSCPQYTFSTEGLLMHDANGAEIALSDFAVGDTVYVSYTGEVLESDPAVIVTPTKLQLN